MTTEWLNYYECPVCEHHWYDVWDCQVNHECPECRAQDISPKDSYELEDGGVPQPGKCTWTAIGHSIAGKLYKTSCEAEIDEAEIHEKSVYCPFCGEEYQYDHE